MQSIPVVPARAVAEAICFQLSEPGVGRVSSVMGSFTRRGILLAASNTDGITFPLSSNSARIRQSTFEWVDDVALGQGRNRSPVSCGGGFSEFLGCCIPNRSSVILPQDFTIGKSAARRSVPSIFLVLVLLVIVLGKTV